MNTSTLVAATVFWMGREPLCMNHQYTLKIHTQRVSCTLHSIDKVIDAETLDALENHGELGRYMAGEVVFRLQNPVVFDAFTECPTTGRFVVVDGYDVAGGGIINRIPELLQERQEISPRSMFISPKEGLVSMKERADRRKHRGHVVWLTGLSGSGKSRIAQRMERSLWDSAIDAYYLDSSNVRMTLSSDLAFSEKQRREHSRRVAELANYLMHAGHVVIVSIISPFQDDREYARGIIGERNFSEVFINTPLDVCKRRNPHGIYTKVASAEIKGVPGIDLPYEQSERLIHTIHIKNIDTPLEPIADELAEVIMKNVT